MRRLFGGFFLAMFVVIGILHALFYHSKNELMAGAFLSLALALFCFGMEVIFPRKDSEVLEDETSHDACGSYEHSCGDSEPRS